MYSEQHKPSSAKWHLVLCYLTFTLSTLCVQNAKEQNSSPLIHHKCQVNIHNITFINQCCNSVQKYIFSNLISGIVHIVTRLWAGQSGVSIPAGSGNFSLLQNIHDQLWSHHGLYCAWQSGQVMRLTTCLHLVMRLRITWATSPLSLYASWRVYRKNLPFYLCYKMVMQIQTPLFYLVFCVLGITCLFTLEENTL